MATTPRKAEIAADTDTAAADAGIVHTDPTLTPDQRSAAAQRRKAADLGGGVDDAARRQGYLDALAEERRGYVQRAAGATGETRERLEARIAAVDAEAARVEQQD